VKTAASYMSANDPRMHIGLGNYSEIDELTLRWPSGKTQLVHHLAAGSLHVISEEKGLVDSVKLAGKAASSIPSSM
jgi:hypothetical protein